MSGRPSYVDRSKSFWALRRLGVLLGASVLAPSASFAEMPPYAAQGGSLRVELLCRWDRPGVIADFRNIPTWEYQMTRPEARKGRVRLMSLQHNGRAYPASELEKVNAALLNFVNVGQIYLTCGDPYTMSISGEARMSDTLGQRKVLLPVELLERRVTPLAVTDAPR